MHCGYTEKTILYFYGEAAGERAREIKEHIGSCADCAAELEVLRSLSESFGSSRIRVPELCAGELVRAAARPSFAASFFDWAGRIAVAAAFTAAFLGAFLTIGGANNRIAWASPDAALDAAESGIYNLSEDISSSADFDYEYADIEARKEVV